ncbi:MAG: 4Fe-4S binding protein [Chloroflexota bacterium]|nr:4Fe-4S binding protein [Chloroflexota bacterium]
MSEQEIYQRLVEWLRQGWVDLPDADELIPLVMATCTPEEASLLTGMPFSGRNLEELAEMKGVDPNELRQRLDVLAKKGVVFRTVKEDTIRYSLNDVIFTFYRSAFWPGRTDDRSKAMAPPANQYYYHGFWGPHKNTHLKNLRVLPIYETIEDTRTILPYEAALKLLDAWDYFTVTSCACRHRKRVDPDFHECDYPDKVCLHFGRLGHYIVENDLGREITREETEELLRQSAEAGLVHSVGNFKEPGDTICNCCKCCCMFFEPVHKLGHAQGITPSSFIVHNNPKTCVGCGLCVKRCPMEAIRLEDSPEAKDRITVVTDEDKGAQKELKNKKGRVSVVNTDICVGCGVCAYKCPTKSLTMTQRDVIEEPPDTAREWSKLLAEDIAATWDRGE